MKGTIKWDWVFWQVVAPLFTPIAISLAVVFYAQLGPHPYPIKWDIVADAPPWALIFFCLTLIGAALHDLWPEKQHDRLAFILLVLGFFLAILAGKMVDWRQTESNFTPGAPLYLTTGVFLFVSIGLCHRAAK
jgi:hypothetical protein